MFTVIGWKFKFQVQDSFLEYILLEIWKTHRTFWKKATFSRSIQQIEPNSTSWQYPWINYPSPISTRLHVNSSNNEAFFLQKAGLLSNWHPLIDSPPIFGVLSRKEKKIFLHYDYIVQLSFLYFILRKILLTLANRQGRLLSSCCKVLRIKIWIEIIFFSKIFSYIILRWYYNILGLGMKVT